MVIVGSGPAHLVRAIDAASDGRRTVVVESSGQLGGAWAAVAAFDDDTHRYEVVPHHLSPYLDAYEMLEAAGIELVARPIHAWDHSVLDAEARRWYETNYGDAFPVAEAGSARLLHEDQWYTHQDWLDPSLRPEIDQRKSFHRDVNRNVKYFRGGVQALIDRLTRRLAETGCSVLTNTRVERVRTLPAGRVVADATTFSFTSDHVMLGQHYSGMLELPDLPGEPERVVPYASLLVRVRLEREQAVRYVNVRSDPGERFGTMSYLQLTRSQLNVFGEGVVTYCIGGSFDPEHDPWAAAEQLLQRMAVVGVVDGAYEIWDARWRTLEVHAHSRNYCSAIEPLSGGAITMTHVAALGQEMSEHRDLWARALGVCS